MINYCILLSGISTSGGRISDSHFTESPPIPRLVYHLSLFRILSVIFRDEKKVFLPLDRKGHCSVFKSQLLTDLPLTISLSFGHSSPAATSAASRQRQAMCTWPGSRTPSAVTKTTEGMSVKLFCNLKHDLTA